MCDGIVDCARQVAKTRVSSIKIRKMMPDPLVLLPGLMCDARVFQHQLGALSGCRAVHVAPTRNADRIERLAEQVLADAPPKFALLGHGLGGMVAMEVQRCAPDRVSRIALISTNAQAELPKVAAARESQIVRAKSGKFGEVIDEELKFEYLAARPGRAAVIELFYKMASDHGADAYVRQSRAMQRRKDQQKTLRKMKISTLFLCGEHDSLTPVRRHEFMATLVPNAQFWVVPDAGHLPTLEQPEITTQLLLKWLDGPLVLR